MRPRRYTSMPFMPGTAGKFWGLRPRAELFKPFRLGSAVVKQLAPMEWVYSYPAETRSRNLSTLPSASAPLREFLFLKNHPATPRRQRPRFEPYTRLRGSSEQCASSEVVHSPPEPISFELLILSIKIIQHTPPLTLPGTAVPGTLPTPVLRGIHGVLPASGAHSATRQTPVGSP